MTVTRRYINSLIAPGRAAVPASSDNSPDDPKAPSSISSPVAGADPSLHKSVADSTLGEETHGDGKTSGTRG